MESIQVTTLSREDHCAQIVTGFAALEGYQVTFTDRFRDRNNPYAHSAVVLAQYRGKKLVYDTNDGYNQAEEMGEFLRDCDFYFKRSFSREENQARFPQHVDKIFPLGFNYHVTHRGTLVGNDPLWREVVKRLAGKTPRGYFTPERFVCQARRVEEPKIIFFTRLWGTDAARELKDEWVAERHQINRMRIDILQALRERYGDRFTGGLVDEPCARELAPQLIVDQTYTLRKNYLELMKASDIAIGSMGLHGSIGWKTGEYVAGAKAIVNERFCYEVPGNFREGTHYLPYSTVEECLEAVRRLVDDPDLRYAMAKANETYYRDYLKPERLIGNTLEIVQKFT